MDDLYDGPCEAGCQHYHGGEVCHTPGCGHYPESLTKAFEDRIAAQAAAIERLTAEKAAADAEVKRLREAIRPFVEYVHDDTRKGDYRYKFVRTVDLGGGWIAAEDLRRARAALKETSHD